MVFNNYIPDIGGKKDEMLGELSQLIGSSTLPVLQKHLKSAEKFINEASHTAMESVQKSQEFIATNLAEVLRGLVDVCKMMATGSTAVTSCPKCYRRLLLGVVQSVPFNSIVFDKSTPCDCQRSTFREMAGFLVLNKLVLGKWSLNIFDASRPAGVFLTWLRDLGMDVDENGEINVQSGKDEVSHTTQLVNMFKFFIPGLSISEKEFGDLYSYCRKAAATISFTTILFGFLTGLLALVVRKLQTTPDAAAVQQFIQEADAILPVYEDESGFGALQTLLAKHCEERRKFYQLIKRGIDISHGLSILPADKGWKIDVEKRTDRLKALLTKAVPSFVGTEQKRTPFIFYFHGPAGQGKTCLKNFLFKDLFNLLEFPEFEDRLDTFAFNPVSGFWDGYNHQPVVLFEDYLQMNDKNIMLSEVSNLIHIGDTSPYNLHMADCPNKGITFFTSEFVFVTSNVDPTSRRTVLSNIMADPEALFRRINLKAAVMLTDPSKCGRDAYSFTIGGVSMTYTEMLRHVYNAVKDHHKSKQFLSSVSPLPDNVLDDIRSSTTAGSPHVVKCPKCYYCAEPCQECRNTVAEDPLRVIRIDGQLVSRAVLFERHPFKIFCATQDCKLHQRCDLCAELYQLHFRHFCGEWIRSLKKPWCMLRVDNQKIVHSCDPDTCKKQPTSLVLKSFYRAAVQSGVEPEEEPCTVQQPGTSYMYLPPASQIQYSEDGVIKKVYKQACSVLECLYQWLRKLTSGVYCGTVSTVLWITSKFSTNCQNLFFNHMRNQMLVRMGTVMVNSFSLLVALLGARSIVRTLFPSSNATTQGLAQSAPHQTVSRKSFRKIVDRTGNVVSRVESGVLDVDHGVYMKSMVRVKNGRFSVLGFFVKERIMMFPIHIVTDPTNNLECTFCPTGFSNVTFTFSIREYPTVYCQERHVYLVDLGPHPVVSKMPCRKNMVKRFCTTKESVDANFGQMLAFERSGLTVMPVIKLLENIRLQKAPLYMHDPETNIDYVTDCSIAYNGATSNGDCGSLIFVSGNGGERIVGMHIAAHAGKYQAFGAHLTTDFLETGCRALEDPNPVVVQAGDAPEYLAGRESIRYVGKLDKPLMHMSHTTKLKQSPLYYEPHFTEPAQLGGICKDTNYTPLQKSMAKFPEELPIMQPGVIESAVARLECHYRDGIRKLRFLSVEDAVFGLPDEDYLRSIDSSASVGHVAAFEGRNFTRRDLICMDDRTIHPMLITEIESIHRALLERKKPEFYCVDLLKDERLPIPKVEIGKTRVFTVLPLPVNIVLKQLFGDFCANICELQRTHAAKVGMSSKEQDVLMFAEYLKISDESRRFLCGDVSNSDRVIPFELFMELVHWVNRLYDDEYAEQRILLAQSVFNPNRAAGVDVYKSLRGMPSGLYLTAVFNSLAYAALLFQSLYEYGVSTGVVAVFGDDMVVSVEQNTISNFDLARSFAKYGVEYTSSSKDKPLEHSVGVDEIVFLQRSFARYRGRWTFPLPVDRIVEGVKWYRVTSETRKWSNTKLVDILLDTAATELVHHGPETFRTVLYDLASRVQTRPTIHLQFEHYWLQFLDMTPIAEAVPFPIAHAPTIIDHLPECHNVPIVCQSGGDEENPLCCALCTMWFSDEFAKKQHLAGSIHQRRLDFSPGPFACTICCINTTGSAGLQQHINGKRHQRALEFRQRLPQCSATCQSGNDGEVSGTRIETDNQSTRVVGLTKLQDYGPVQSYGETFPDLYPTDEPYRWEDTSARTLERFFIMDTFELSTSDISHLPIKRYEPWRFLLSRPYIDDRLVNSVYIRADIELNIRVIATKFAYGAIMVVPRPWYGANQGRPFVDAKSDPGKIHYKYPYCSWDTLATASQNPHAIVSLTSSNPHVLMLKWQGPMNYLERTKWNVSPSTEPWVVDIYALTPALPVDIDKPQLQVSVSFRNVSLYGYGSLPTLPAWIPVEFPNTMVPKFKDLAINPPRVQSGVEEVEDMENFRFWSRGVRVVGDFANMFIPGVSMLSSFVSDVLAYFGWSNPSNPNKPDVVAMNTLPLAHSIGPSPAVSTSFDASDELPSLDGFDGTASDIARLIATPTYIGTHLLSAKDDSFTVKFAPLTTMQYTVEDRTYFVPLPSAYIASMFQTFRATPVVRLRIFASAMLNTRAVLSYSRTGDFSNEGIVPSWYIDISGDYDNKFSFPFVAARALIPTTEDLGAVQFKLVSDVITTEASAMRSIAVVVFLSFEGAQVYLPGPLRQSDINVRYLPVTQTRPKPGEQDNENERPLVQSGIELPVDAYNRAPQKARSVGPSDIPCNLLHMIKRPNDIRRFKKKGNMVVQPYAVVPKAVTVTKPAVENVFVGPLHAVFSCMFKYMRGGSRVVMGRGLGFDDILVNVALWENADLVGKLGDTVQDYLYAASNLIGHSYDKTVATIPYRYPYSFAFCLFPGTMATIDETAAGKFVDGSDLFFPAVDDFSKTYQFAVKYSAGWMSVYAADDFSFSRFIGLPFMVARAVNDSIL